MVSLEDHHCWTQLGLQNFSSRDYTLQRASISTNGSLDHRDGRTKAQNPLLEENGGIPKRQYSVVVDHNSIKFGDTVSFREPQYTSVRPGEASLGTAQPHKAILLPLNQDCCDGCPLSAPAADVQLDQVIQDHPSQTLDVCCGYAKTVFSTIKPISTGSIHDMDSNLTLVVDSTVSNLCQRAPNPPHIVKYKQSSITFSDNTCSSGSDGHPFANESSEDGGSSPEGEKEEEDGDDDDDVFVELPHSRDPLISLKRRNKGKKNRRLSLIHI